MRDDFLRTLRTQELIKNFYTLLCTVLLIPYASHGTFPYSLDNAYVSILFVFYMP